MTYFHGSASGSGQAFGLDARVFEAAKWKKNKAINNSLQFRPNLRVGEGKRE